jgi:ankyrin repeat protein
LLWATQKGHTNLVKFFLDNGCQYNEKSEREYWIPILLACRYGFIDIVRLLHEAGQDLNEGKENDLWFPLHWAAYYNRTETGKYLLEHGAQIDVVTKDGSRPIHFAALQGHADFIKLLLDFGEKADIKQPSEWAYTPLMWSAQLGHFDCVRMLVKDFSVELHHKCGKINKTAAELASMYNFPDINAYINQEQTWRNERPIREMVAKLSRVREKQLWYDIDIITQSE